MANSSMRVSDEQRERVVRDLTRHCGDGRLTLDELEERVAEAYAAMTKAELAHAMRHLPPEPRPSGPPVRVKPSSPERAAAPARPTRRRRQTPAEIALRAHLHTYLSVMALLVAIWFLTSPFGYFWPIWPAMGWGVGLAIHAGVEKAKGPGRW